MDKVKWSDGLSTGVEIIDSDHKKILSLINQITEAIEQQQTQKIMAAIFDELDNYTRKHFAREEELMRDCHYEGLKSHIKKHRAFTKKTTELKHKLLTSNSREIAEEVSLFLINWLINHIVAEDQLYVPAVNKHGLTTHQTQDKNNLFNRVATWLSRHLVLSKRIFLTTLLPAVAITFFSVLIILNSVRELNEVKLQNELFHLVNKAGKLIHRLQAERGFSIGMVSSNYTAFNKALIAQRQLSDKSVDELNYQFSELSSEFENMGLNHHIEQIKLDLKHLAALRLQIDTQSISTDEIRNHYTKIIHYLLTLPGKTTQQPSNSEFNNHITTLSIIMHLKEAMGLERALGTKLIEQGELMNSKDIHEIVSLIGRQDGFLRMFMFAAKPAALSLYQQFANSEEALEASAIETKLFEAIDVKNINVMESAVWFDKFSKKMDKLESLSNLLVKNFNNHANQEILKLKWKLYLTTALLLSLLLLSLLLYKLLTRSITLPIGQLTRAIVYLSAGNRDHHFTEELANDELSQIAAAYELCRLNLLQGDLECLELQHKDRENEYFKELASLDPLTGIYNRRMFDILADIELERSRRHEYPLTTLMLDIDFFKKINDAYSHACGDLILKSFTEACISQLRSSDIFARIGGEEFTILLPQTNLSKALQIAERIRMATQEMKIIFDDQVICYTISIGVAQWDNEVYVTLDELLHQADLSLYTAKTSGRNRVCHNESIAPNSLTEEAHTDGEL